MTLSLDTIQTYPLNDAGMLRHQPSKRLPDRRLALPRRIAIAELAGVPFAAVSVTRVSYAVSAAAPPAGRRLRRLLADGYSTLQVGSGCGIGQQHVRACSVTCIGSSSLSPATHTSHAPLTSRSDLLLQCFQKHGKTSGVYKDCMRDWMLMLLRWKPPSWPRTCGSRSRYSSAPTLRCCSYQSCRTLTAGSGVKLLAELTLSLREPLTSVLRPRTQWHLYEAFQQPHTLWNITE